VYYIQHIAAGGQGPFCIIPRPLFKPFNNHDMIESFPKPAFFSLLVVKE
jgi:hypothetical protein